MVMQDLLEKNCYASFWLSLLLFVMCYKVFLPSFLGIKGQKFRTDDVQNFTLNLGSGKILLLYEKVDFFEYLIQSFKSTTYLQAVYGTIDCNTKIKRPEIHVTIFPTREEISKTLSRGKTTSVESNACATTFHTHVSLITP